MAGQNCRRCAVAPWSSPSGLVCSISAYPSPAAPRLLLVGWAAWVSGLDKLPYEPSRLLSDHIRVRCPVYKAWCLLAFRRNGFGQVGFWLSEVYNVSLAAAPRACVLALRARPCMPGACRSRLDEARPPHARSRSSFIWGALTYPIRKAAVHRAQACCSGVLRGRMGAPDHLACLALAAFPSL